MDWLIENMEDVLSKLPDFFTSIVDIIVGVADALRRFLTMLEDFDNTLVAMTESTGSSEFVGMPIVDAIGTIRYLTGDVAFFMIYAGILLGCLFTVYKLVVLLFEAIEGLVMQISGVSCKQYFGNLLTNIFK